MLMMCWFRGSKINHLFDNTDSSRVTLCGRPIVDKMRTVRIIDTQNLCKSCNKINSKLVEDMEFANEDQKV